MGDRRGRRLLAAVPAPVQAQSLVQRCEAMLPCRRPGREPPQGADVLERQEGRIRHVPPRRARQLPPAGLAAQVRAAHEPPPNATAPPHRPLGPAPIARLSWCARVARAIRHSSASERAERGDDERHRIRHRQLPRERGGPVPRQQDVPLVDRGQERSHHESDDRRSPQHRPMSHGARQTFSRGAARRHELVGAAPREDAMTPGTSFGRRPRRRARHTVMVSCRGLDPSGTPPYR